MKSETLRRLIRSRDTLVMPDAYDPMSARIIEGAGYRAVQCSGYSMSLAQCLPDETDLTLDQNLVITHAMAMSVSVPIMADGEDGYGPPEDVFETVRRFKVAGADGVNLEDQVLPRQGRVAVVDAEEMCDKLRAAREAALSEDDDTFVLNGRTDALRSVPDPRLGLRLAADRANRYLEAGADLAFVTGVKTLEEAAFLVREVQGPLSIAAGLPYNIRCFSVADLARLGVARVSLPTLLAHAAVRGMTHALELLRETGGFDAMIEGGRLPAPEDLRKVVS